jgi:hypothetical protein
MLSTRIQIERSRKQRRRNVRKRVRNSRRQERSQHDRRAPKPRPSPRPQLVAARPIAASCCYKCGFSQSALPAGRFPALFYLPARRLPSRRPLRAGFGANRQAKQHGGDERNSPPSAPAGHPVRPFSSGRHTLPSSPLRSEARPSCESCSPQGDKEPKSRRRPCSASRANPARLSGLDAPKERKSLVKARDHPLRACGVSVCVRSVW